MLLFAYAMDDGPVRVWDRTQDIFPADLFRWLNDDSIFLTAHNAMFDRTMITHALDIPTRPERWRCTMAKAYSHAFPGSLEACGAALGLPKDKAKLADGKKLINRFCKPAPSNHKAERYDHTTHPEEWAKFIHYAAMDIEAVREVDKRLPSWNWKESDVALYHLDQRINDRGFRVDQELTAAGARAAAADKARMAAEFVQITGEAVERPTQRAKFCDYLNDRFDLGIDNTRAETFRELIAGDQELDPECQQLMEISIMSNKTSTAKYATLAPAVSKDGRFRGGLQFRGAARTRRWAGRTFQPQNLPSRGLPAQRSIDQYIRALKADMHEVLFDDLMLYGSAALRGVVIAPDNQKLAIADLSNIEGRVNAWLAGESWKIQAFFDFDAGRGPDLYNITAGGILGKDPYKIGKKDRNVFGKVPELALGYEGGYGALETFCKSYGVLMADHEETIRANVDSKYLSAAKANYTKWGAEKNPEADPTEWLARETVKLGWRGRHPKIVQLWKACKEAAKLAIQNPGKTFRAGAHLRFKVQRHAGLPYLLCRLPSGNFLCYCEPRYHEKDGAITYMGIDSSATGGMYGKWQRLYTYGGKIVENACQSLAMDIMAANMPEIDASGFPIILTVHDEDICEPTNGGTGAVLAAMMAKNPEWLPNFPLAAAGYETYRYRKD
ncbi:MAG: DNA polymerase I [Alphaproteobacteria bacterium]|nr:DNA polymerase I [Alphaproteobacteria bacterium]